MAAVSLTDRYAIPVPVAFFYMLSVEALILSVLLLPQMHIGRQTAANLTTTPSRTALTTSDTSREAYREGGRGRGPKVSSAIDLHLISSVAHALCHEQHLTKLNSHDSQHLSLLKRPTHETQGLRLQRVVVHAHRNVGLETVSSADTAILVMISSLRQTY